MKKTIGIIAVLVVGMVTACSEDQLDKRNPNQLTPDSYFKNATELVAGVNSVYGLMQGNSLVGREWFFLNHLRGDDFQSGGGQLEAPRNQLLIGSHNPANAVMNEVWNGLYRSIHRANTVIEKAPNATDANSELAKRAVGEAKFLRGWSYLELVTHWGGVPIYKQTVSTLTGTAPRSSETDVYALVIEDLNAAEAALPVKYSGVELGRATKGTAQLAKARAYLNRADYANAKTELQKIVASGAYKLTDEYADNFREENEWNSESVFEIGYSSVGDINWAGDGDDPSWGNQEKQVRTQEYSATGWRNLMPSQTLIDEFEGTAKGDAKDDPRRAASFLVVGDKYNNGTSVLADNQVQGNTTTIDGKVTKVSWGKYGVQYKSDPGGYNTSGINYRVMRYAEVLLSLAEAENELGNSAAAIALLNQVRARKSVAMPAYPTSRFKVSNKDEIFAAVVHERRVELNGEEVRNRDLLRWRKAGKLTGALAPKYQYQYEAKFALLPIPQAEIDNNDKIDQKDQNPGY